MAVDRDWWVAVNGVWLGYWPASNFDLTGLGLGAVDEAFGGEIVDRRPGAVPTGTDMGSG